MTEGADPRVRRYRPGDGPAVRAVHERALREAGTDPDDVPGNDDLRRIERAYLDSGGEFLVVDLGTSGASEVVATGGYKPAEGEGGTETVELFRMAVAPEHQGEGYGGRVLSALERRAKESGFERAVLSTAARQGSAGFYAAHGYRETGRERYGAYELVRFEKRL
ncbi:GNAT family N-acetyltransferase [Salinirubellus sp. GCM10025818]|uniref:GNAT family N-acetyltransferase n=1 Tax=Salinirubellus TaxID=2162630 RepID=UPI0030D1AB4E